MVVLLGSSSWHVRGRVGGMSGSSGSGSRREEMVCRAEEVYKQAAGKAEQDPRHELNIVRGLRKEWSSSLFFFIFFLYLKKMFKSSKSE